MAPPFEDVEYGLLERPSNTTCLAGARPTGAIAVQLERAFEDVAMQQPIAAYQAPGEPEFWYVVQQNGIIFKFHEDANDRQRQEVLDYSAEITGGGELGLLGLAFHPDFAQNKKVYISYTYTAQGDYWSRISEMAVSADGSFDGSTERTLLDIKQPYKNHNGGMIDFGPDGMLYIAMGDGGSARDPLNSGQDTTTLLGAMLRIDINREQAPLPYGIPQDNPFASSDTDRKEIYAWGLRNPWKFSFDVRTGELWTGDVGQGAQEEVDVIKLAGNYGWKVREGELCHNNDPECDTRKDFIEPVAVYGRGEGKSITGGYVYHGERVPELQGKYIYGDFASGKIWALSNDPVTGDYEPVVMFETSGLSISSFAQDQGSGEVFIIDYDPRGSNGGAGMYRIAPRDVGEQEGRRDMPATLSATGCVSANNPGRMVDGAIPYAPRAPFWSDGADKSRYIALPDGATITRGAQGWSYPEGTVFIKHFDRAGKRIETRLFVRHDDGIWAGYSYAWRADQSDADLLRTGAVSTAFGEPWKYPSRSACLSCHSASAGSVLGFESLQLAGHDALYAGGTRRADQLTTLDHIGLLSPALEPGDIAGAPELVDPHDDTQDMGARARAYLHSNCAYCHVEDGVARGDIRLGALTALSDTKACDVAPELDALGIPDARLIAPGAPERSVLLQRMKRRDARQMPSDAGLVQDARGVALIEAWISQLSSCEP
jgi:uncharacterized repeat protein (TIGR03806 family)